MDLAQLSVTYDRENDRILTRFNTQEGHELRVWLTRRLLSRAHQPLLDAMPELFKIIRLYGTEDGWESLEKKPLSDKRHDAAAESLADSA